ncbi:cation:proton antiporter [Polycladomyces subterraneus]|uniref:Cation:proton antiporter n=1 Tax=Polycladomyces subterraneus TaxID=1016997 RepID=A0ABT8IQR5_9BACL|nr:cation:proton antiporter [Polycladomyces subterraneus]MDN4595107.1 cation:proton antiporter [Polycladomyces subterraneus]
MKSEVMEIAQTEMYMFTMVFLLGLIATRLAQRIRIPDFVLFLILGMLVGPAGLNWIVQPGNSVAYQFIILIGSTLILFEGGRAIQFSVLKRVWITVTLLSVPGVLITAAIVTVTAVALLKLPVLYAALLAAVIASTDPATLIPVFRQVAVEPRVRQTVESESAFNDATGSILTFTVLELILGETRFSAIDTIWSFVREAGGGLIIGILIGWLGLLVTSEHRIGVFRRYGTVVSLLVAIGSYLVVGSIHASGFMATFAAGVVFGNPDLFRLRIPEDTVSEIVLFGDTVTLLLRKLIFVLLGTQVNFAVLSQYWWQGILVVFVLMFVARPLTVLACTLPDRLARWRWREVLFFFWVRETGVIPAALSGMIVGAGVAHANVIAAVTFIAILFTIVLQASTTGVVARWLGVAVAKE